MSELSCKSTEGRQELLEPDQIVVRLNRTLLGWANSFYLRPVSPAYWASHAHAIKRRDGGYNRWSCRPFR